jgi:hypothetical protein
MQKTPARSLSGQSLAVIFLEPETRRDEDSISNLLGWWCPKCILSSWLAFSLGSPFDLWGIPLNDHGWYGVLLSVELFMISLSTAYYHPPESGRLRDFLFETVP